MKQKLNRYQTDLVKMCVIECVSIARMESV